MTVLLPLLNVPIQEGGGLWGRCSLTKFLDPQGLILSVTKARSLHSSAEWRTEIPFHEAFQDLALFGLEMKGVNFKILPQRKKNDSG